MSVPAAKPRDASAVAGPLPISDAARGELAAGRSVRAYLSALAERGLTTDAVRVLAAALPKSEVVWWGWMCVSEASQAQRPPAQDAALAAVAEWLRDSSDDRRRECGRLADVAGWDTPAGCLAAAAWLSGGSISPQKLPSVPPAEGLAGRSVTGALLLVASSDPANAPIRLRRFLELGLSVANGEIHRATPKA